MHKCAKHTQPTDKKAYRVARNGTVGALGAVVARLALAASEVVRTQAVAHHVGVEVLWVRVERGSNTEVTCVRHQQIRYGGTESIDSSVNLVVIRKLPEHIIHVYLTGYMNIILYADLY